jgi:hypothetical protein
MDSEIVKKCAMLMAVAYWRGRMEVMRETISPDVFESLIEAAAKKEVGKWIFAARAIEE